MLENIEPLPFEQTTDIMVPIASEMVADFSPAIEHLIEIGLEINSHAHSDIAGIFERYTGISLDFRGDGVAGVAGILEPETHNYKLNIIDTLNSPRSISRGGSRQGIRPTVLLTQRGPFLQVLIPYCLSHRLPLPTLPRFMV